MFGVGYCGYNIRNENCAAINRPNGSMDYLLVLFLAPMTVYTDEGYMEANVGSMIIYTPGHRHWYHAKKSFINSFVHFTDSDNYIAGYNLPLNYLFSVSDYSGINEIIRHIESEFRHQLLHKEDSIDSYVKQMLVMLARELNGTHEESKISKPLIDTFLSIRMEILSNLDKDWDIESMAEMAHMGKSQFCHYYRIIFNLAPKTDLINARMEYARYLLSNEYMLVRKVAGMIGYSSEYYFIKAFKKHYGITPKQYSISFSDAAGEKK